MRTDRDMVMTSGMPNASPVPFGGGSYADMGVECVDVWVVQPRLQCLSAVGPMRT